VCILSEDNVPYYCRKEKKQKTKIKREKRKIRLNYSTAPRLPPDD
jgi:hypothetical protein